MPTIQSTRNAEGGTSHANPSEKHYGLLYLPRDRRSNGRKQFQVENDHKTILWIQDTSIPEADDLFGLWETQVRCSKVTITVFLPI